MKNGVKQQGAVQDYKGGAGVCWRGFVMEEHSTTANPMSLQPRRFKSLTGRLSEEELQRAGAPLEAARGKRRVHGLRLSGSLLSVASCRDHAFPHNALVSLRPNVSRAPTRRAHSLIVPK